MKKIIVFSTYDDITNPYYHGGGAISIHEVAKRLAKKHTIKVISSRYRGCKNEEKIDEITYQRIGYTPDIFPPLGQLLFLLLLPLKLLSMRFDLWFESFTPPYSSAFLPIYTRKPIIAISHFLSGQEMTKRYKLPFNLIENLGLKLYSQAISPSKEPIERMKKANKKIKVDIIMNGIAEPKACIKKAKKQVLFVGRIEIQQKGIDLLIQACANYLPKDWRLAIAGGGIKNEEDELRAMIKESGIENRVKIVGRVTQESLEKVYAESALVVIPSRFETFSMVALEAMAHGLPMVAFNINGLSWIPKGAVISAKTDDSDSLGKAMLQLIKNERKRKLMSAVGRKFAKNNSWENVADKYDKLIEKYI